MGGRLNPQSPELKWKDSVKKELKKQETQTPALNCYGEEDDVSLRLDRIELKKLKDLSYMERLGIAKWFQKQNELSEFLIDLLFIDIKHLLVTNVNAIDPVAKFYISKDEYRLLSGHDYTIEPNRRPQFPKLPRKEKEKDRSNKLNFSKSETPLRKFSIDGGGKKKSKKKSKNK